MKIFPFGPGANECMLYGTVQYGLKAGGESGLDWAARAHLVKDNGRVKMDFYQVYLVSTAASVRLVLTRVRTLALRVSSHVTTGCICDYKLAVRSLLTVDTLHVFWY